MQDINVVSDFDEFFFSIFDKALEFLDTLHLPILFPHISFWKVLVAFFFIGTIINLITDPEDDED